MRRAGVASTDGSFATLSGSGERTVLGGTSSGSASIPECSYYADEPGGGRPLGEHDLAILLRHGPPQPGAGGAGQGGWGLQDAWGEPIGPLPAGNGRMLRYPKGSASWERGRPAAALGVGDVPMLGKAAPRDELAFPTTCAQDVGWKADVQKQAAQRGVSASRWRRPKPPSCETSFALSFRNNAGTHPFDAPPFSTGAFLT